MHKYGFYVELCVGRMKKLARVEKGKIVTKRSKNRELPLVNNPPRMWYDNIMTGKRR
jgi:hypothetical protein